MQYSALIENRKSVREFTDKQVPFSELEKIRDYYNRSVRRLIPEIATQLYFFGVSTQAALEGAAGYNQFLVGAPQYLVLMSDRHELAHINAGFLMEDLVLKLTDLGLDSCWMTFTDSEDVKNALGIESDMDVAAIVAFGYGKKTTRRLRLNIRSMSNVDFTAKHRYMEPKRSVYDMAYLDNWGEGGGRLRDHVGFYDDVLWEALYAASLSPSYLNRQAYGFLLREGRVYLIRRPDAYTTKIDGDLSLGIGLLHFTAVAESWTGKVNWLFGPAEDVELPEDHTVVASCRL